MPCVHHVSTCVATPLVPPSRSVAPCPCTGVPSQALCCPHPHQVRGSVPLYWSQQQAGTLQAKPDIVLHHYDPLYQVGGLNGWSGGWELYCGAVMQQE